MPVRSPVLRSSALLLMTLVATAACHRSDVPSSAAEQQAADVNQREEVNSVRSELETIPPPTKAKFSTLRSLDSWQNPYLTVQDRFLVLHVTVADPIPGGIGQGGFLRPIGARRQNLTVRLTELPGALEAVPHTAWPYGRVIAVEEAHNTPRAAEPDVRRTMEAVMRTLSDLGVVVYEWTDNGPEIR